MSKFTFNHLALSVKNVEESVDFYQRILDLEEIPNTASNSQTRWLSLGEGKQLHLIPRPEFQIVVNKAVHLALQTDNFNAFRKQLEFYNITYTNWKDTGKDTYVRNDGIQQLYFQDPNGYWIEVNGL